MSRAPIVTKRRLTRVRRRAQFRARVELAVRAYVHDRLFNDDTFIADRICPVVEGEVVEGEVVPSPTRRARASGDVRAGALLVRNKDGSVSEAKPAVVIDSTAEHPAKARLRAMRETSS